MNDPYPFLNHTSIVFVSQSQRSYLVLFDRINRSAFSLFFLSRLSFGTSNISTVFKAATTSNMLRRFLSRVDFDQMSITPRPQIIKWRLLEIGAVFRVIDRIIIPTATGAPDKIYVVLETEQQEIINVWITPIINQELLKYNLEIGNVFIKPLGMKTSNSSGKEYFNFSVVLDVNNFLCS